MWIRPKPVRRRHPDVLVAATPAHASAMALVHGRAFAVRERWGADAIGLQLGLPGAFGWIAPAGGMILARTVADEAEVLTLAVDPAVQRQGVGRALLHRGLATARERGAQAIFLEVAADNAAAQALYCATGFTVVGRRPDYYPGGGDAVVLRRPL
jgi:ribosomal-protein-alanine N-acetyltransferase